jgi:hypothetical protein
MAWWLRCSPMIDPAMWVFILSLVLVVLAVVSVFVAVPYLSMYTFWVAVLAYVVLALSRIPMVGTYDDVGVGAAYHGSIKEVP